MHFKKYLAKPVCILVEILIGVLITLPAYANQPTLENMVFCENGYRQLTLHESETPRMIEQDIILRKPGTFIVTVTGDGFSFQGLSYSRQSYGRKWTPIQKTQKGQNRWSQSWQVRSYEYETRIRLQLIKDRGACKACTAKLEISAQCS